MRQLERNLDAQIITAIDRESVMAAAPLPELKLVNYATDNGSGPMQQLQGGCKGNHYSLKLSFVQFRSHKYGS